jgi:outer membrane protein TolC
MFGDPVLNGLEEKVATNNFTLAADLAAYQQARALVSEQRAALWPTLTGSGSANVSERGAGASAATNAASGLTVGRSSSSTNAQYQLELGATWEPDLWGKVRREIENAKGTAQASGDGAGGRLHQPAAARRAEAHR